MNNYYENILCLHNKIYCISLERTVEVSDKYILNSRRFDSTNVITLKVYF
jgi:hypothetical protein